LTAPHNTTYFYYAEHCSFYDAQEGGYVPCLGHNFDKRKGERIPSYLKVMTHPY
jgi:hypothetical protein